MSKTIRRLMPDGPVLCTSPWIYVLKIKHQLVTWAVLYYFSELRYKDFFSFTDDATYRQRTPKLRIYSWG